MATQIYAYPNISTGEGQGMFGLFTYVNTLADGILMPIVLLVVFIILFVVSMYNSKASHAFVLACFVTGILSIPLAILNFLAPSYMYLLGIGLAIGIFWASLDKP